MTLLELDWTLRGKNDVAVQMVILASLSENTGLDVAIGIVIILLSVLIIMERLRSGSCYWEVVSLALGWAKIVEILMVRNTSLLIYKCVKDNVRSKNIWSAGISWSWLYLFVWYFILIGRQVNQFLFAFFFFELLILNVLSQYDNLKKMIFSNYNLPHL